MWFWIGSHVKSLNYYFKLHPVFSEDRSRSDHSDQMISPKPWHHRLVSEGAFWMMAVNFNYDQTKITCYHFQVKESVLVSGKEKSFWKLSVRDILLSFYLKSHPFTSWHHIALGVGLNVTDVSSNTFFNSALHEWKTQTNLKQPTFGSVPKNTQDFSSH